MIIDLHVSQLGAINEAAIECQPGLTVITGETGAGKTMLVASLHAISGSKLSSSIVRHDATQAKISAFWQVPNPSVLRKIEESAGVVEDNMVIVSRTINPQGRSKASLGGQPVPLQKLSSIIGAYVTIHGQNDQLRLLDTSTHRELLDHYGTEQIREKLDTYHNTYQQWKEVTRNYERVTAQAQEIAQEKIQLQAMLEDLETVNIVPGEMEELEQLISDLTNAADQQACIQQLAQILDIDSEHSITAGITQAIKVASSAQHSSMDPLVHQLEQANILITEASAQVASMSTSIIDNTSELDNYLSRQKTLKDACKKYQCTGVELFELTESTRKKLDALHATYSNTDELLEHCQQLHASCVEQAQQITQIRRSIAENLSTKVTSHLADLSMSDAAFHVDITPSELGAYGADTVAFGLQRGQHILALHKSASGGELSRVALATELVLAQQSEPMTFVFDEIDTGVGGQTALGIGHKLAELAHTHQVFVVTHLPQVAAWGHNHWRISKDNTGSTAILPLVPSQRVTELARMLAGLSESSSAQNHAQELLELAGRPIA